MAVSLLALGLFAAGVCLAGGGALVGAVFGRGYARAVDSLRVLALGLPLLFLNYGLTHFLVARDQGRTTLWLSLMMLGLTVALDVALIPRRLGPGAAWATVLAEVALTAACAACLRALGDGGLREPEERPEETEERRELEEVVEEAVDEEGPHRHAAGDPRQLPRGPVTARRAR
jgi:Na+-driven multidrug efflux pump